MGLSGFLKFLKDLNLIKPNLDPSFDTEQRLDPQYNLQVGSQQGSARKKQDPFDPNILEIDISGLSKIKLHKAELLFI